MAQKTERIALPDATGGFQVTLEHDGKKVIYRPVPVTRSVGRAMRKIQREVALLDQQDDDEMTDEQLDAAEEREMRLSCDMLNLALETNAEDAPAAGDMLYDGWAGDEVTRVQVLTLMAQIGEAGQRPS